MAQRNNNVVKQILEVSKIGQIININKIIVNNSGVVRLKTLNGAPFEYSIQSSDEINSESKFNFIQVVDEKIIVLKNNNNQHCEHFLILKSQGESSVEISPISAGEPLTVYNNLFIPINFWKAH